MMEVLKKSDPSSEKKTVKGRVGQNKRSFGSFINKQTNKNVILYVHLCVIYKNTRETCLK